MNAVVRATAPKPSAALRGSGEAADIEFDSRPAGQPVLPCGAATKTWVDFRVLDDQDRPIVNCRVQVDLPDGRSIEDVTDSDGCLGFDGIDPGMCRIALLDLPGQRCERID